MSTTKLIVIGVGAYLLYKWTQRKGAPAPAQVVQGPSAGLSGNAFAGG